VEGQSCFRWRTSTLGSTVAAAEMPIWRDVGRLCRDVNEPRKEPVEGQHRMVCAYHEASGKERPMSTRNVLVLGGELGRPDAVRRTYRLLTRRLADLDVDPDPETEQLVAELLRRPGA
jgi:hypothetical protein